MRQNQFTILLSASFMLLACTFTARAASFSAELTHASLWDDGKAEVARYDASRIIYGEPRPYEMIRVLVSEPFDGEALVKADTQAGRAIVPVLKMHVVERVPTKNYDYHFATSYFIDRTAPRHVLKASYASFEWCGTTYKELRCPASASSNPDEWQFIASSYWDNEGQIEATPRLPQDVLFEDALPVLLRTLKLEEGESLALSVVPTMVSSHAKIPEAKPAMLTRLAPEGTLEAAGQSWALDQRLRYQLSYQESDATVSFEFAAESPHVLLGMEASDGRQAALRDVRRRAYWSD